MVFFSPLFRFYPQQYRSPVSRAFDEALFEEKFEKETVDTVRSALSMRYFRIVSEIH